MNSFRVGERVELISCTDFPGTVTGFVHGKVHVLFDDFSNEPPKPFRPESLQLAKSPARNVNGNGWSSVALDREGGAANGKSTGVQRPV